MVYTTTTGKVSLSLYVHLIEIVFFMYLFLFLKVSDSNKEFSGSVGLLVLYYVGSDWCNVYNTSFGGAIRL